MVVWLCGRFAIRGNECVSVSVKSGSSLFAFCFRAKTHDDVNVMMSKKAAGS